MDIREIDVSKLTLSGKYVVTFNGKVLDVTKPQKGLRGLIATSLDTLIARDGAVCKRCGRTEWLTIDHVVPAWILTDMGVSEHDTYTDFDNLQILCKPCNQFKSNRLDFANPQTKAVLLKHLNQL